MTLSEQFRDSGSTELFVDGRILRSLVEIPATNGTTLTVHRVHSSEEPDQLFNLALDAGQLVVAGRRAPSMRFAMSRSPARIDVEIECDAPTTIRAWNSWVEDGEPVSWRGDAAIDLVTTETAMLLRCSDGTGQLDFANLVVAIDVGQT